MDSFVSQKQKSGATFLALKAAVLAEDQSIFDEAQKPCSCPIYRRDETVLELAKHLNQLRQEDHRLYLASVTYKDLKVPINKLFQQFYVRLLRHVVHPHSYHRKSYRQLQPKVFAFVDGPASKHKTRNQLPRRHPTDELHHHAIFAVRHEIARKFDALCDRIAAAAFIEHLSFIKTIDVQLIHPKDGLSHFESLVKATDYASVYARTHRGSKDDHCLILPIAESEHQQAPNMVGATFHRNVAHPSEFCKT